MEKREVGDEKECRRETEGGREINGEEREWRGERM